ncbi:8-amino-7-oxononanoate synthase [Rhabdobacter roseus]|uniref:7-keto-8-aminopelargonate synthetase-like enzyme n=1 Tax=Rhabdobacter roseus TaxID=1655419 RepID=A0A840TS09_9BACT|nr:aminotransferase class I/II-fold pyridoxal phosphate-dependent enzyme [Rhabdobacter roseus]MBB5282499.1 7-keto-8-aminopelargonate synthetase-like enzyme [Rhabdobacter roseus]
MTTFHTTHQLPGRQVLFDDGQEYLWFSGTDYLGLGPHEGFRRYLHEGLARYGTHFGSSRNNTLQLAVYEEAESTLAQWVGAPAALSTASGMWAGQLVMKYLESTRLGTSVRFHYAPRVHPALWGQAYAATEGTWADWAQSTRRQIAQSTPEQTHVICTDSVGSPWIEAYDFSLFAQLPTHGCIWLVVDDSHGLGVLGPQGKGIYAQVPRQENINVIVVASLNKAMGVPAGVVLAEPEVLAALRQLPWFAGSSPSAPAYMHAFQKLLEMQEYPRAHAQLLANTRYLAERLVPTALFVYKENYPVFCSRQKVLHEYLRQRGILTACFAYPRPTDEPIVRLVVSALHQQEDLDRLAEVCHDFSSKSNGT